MKTFLFLISLLCYTVSFAQADDPSVWIYNKKQEEEAKKKKEDTAYKQFFPIDSFGLIKYTGVIKLDSTSADEIYSRGKIFIAEAYKSAKAVTHLNDDYSRTIIAKPVTTAYSYSWWEGSKEIFVAYVLKIECKDSKYRYTFDSFRWLYFDKNGKTIEFPLEKYKDFSTTRKKWNEFLSQINRNILNIVNYLTTNLSKKQDDF